MAEITGSGVHVCGESSQDKPPIKFSDIKSQTSFGPVVRLPLSPLRLDNEQPIVSAGEALTKKLTRIRMRDTANRHTKKPRPTAKQMTCGYCGNVGHIKTQCAKFKRKKALVKAVRR